MKPPIHQIYGPNSRNNQLSNEKASANRPPLGRAYSKDYLNRNSPQESNIARSNRYAGANSIVEAGRVES